MNIERLEIWGSQRGGHRLDRSSIKFSVEKARWRAKRYSDCVQVRLHDSTSFSDNIYPTSTVGMSVPDRTVSILHCKSAEVNRYKSVYHT